MDVRQRPAREGGTRGRLGQGGLVAVMHPCALPPSVPPSLPLPRTVGREASPLFLWEATHQRPALPAGAFSPAATSPAARLGGSLRSVSRTSVARTSAVPNDVRLRNMNEAT